MTIMRIDVLAQYSPTAFFDRMEELGAFDEIAVLRIMKALYRPKTRKPGGQPARNRDDIEGRLADMDAAGVDMQILSGGRPAQFRRPGQSDRSSSAGDDRTA